MAVDRITSDQFMDLLRTALLSRTRSYDTAYGPIPDVAMRPVSTVLEDQNNNRLRKVSLLMSLENETEFTESDLDTVLFNEDILRPLGSNASTILTFRRSTPFSSTESGLIPRGFPVATSADEASGQAVTFITTEFKDKTSSIATIDTNTNTTVYELSVAAQCTVRGSSGKVGPDRINRPLRPLVGWDSVTNKQGTQEGRDSYTNAEAIELYLLAVSSRQLSVPTGSEFYVRDNFPSVEDIHEVFGTDPLLTRGATDAGAVDAFVVGDDDLTTTDSVTFLGLGQKLNVTNPPVVTISTVTRVADGHVFLEGTDYEVALDTSGVSGSVRAKDGIRFLPTINTNYSGSPGTLQVGESISITYSYNQLIRDLQADNSDPHVGVLGRDLLYRLGTRLDVFLSAELRVVSGFKFSDIQNAVEIALTNFINARKLGQPLDIFLIEGAVSQVAGVDDFTLTRLTDDPLGVGVNVISPTGNQYTRIDSVNLSIVPMT